MARDCKNPLKAKFPDLFLEVSCELQSLANHYGINHTKAELCFMRKNVLDNLRNIGITQDNYNHYRQHFIKLEAKFMELNNMYKASHSFADYKLYNKK